MNNAMNNWSSLEKQRQQQQHSFPSLSMQDISVVQRAMLAVALPVVTEVADIRTRMQKIADPFGAHSGGACLR
jgi:hypothetical protein